MNYFNIIYWIIWKFSIYSLNNLGPNAPKLIETAIFVDHIAYKRLE